MSKILLGSIFAGNDLDLEYVPKKTRDILIQGVKGSRKSTLVSKLVQRFTECTERPQVVEFDFQLEFASHRKFADFILIGEKGEIPFDVKTAEKLGRLVRMANVNVVIQRNIVSTRLEQETYIANFLTGMMSVEPKYYKPCIVVIDELEEFCPSRKPSKSKDMIITLIGLGRKMGFMVLGATLGMKDVDKSARDQMTNRIVGYTFDKTSREQAAELIGMEVKDSGLFLQLDEEPLGRFYAWGSEITKVYKQFQLASEKQSEEEQFITVPPISEEYALIAGELVKKLKLEKTISTETAKDLRISELELHVRKLESNQMSEDTKNALYSKGFKEGAEKAWKECNEANLKVILAIKNAGHGLTDMFKKTKVLVVTKFVDGDGKERFAYDKEYEK